MEIQVTKDHQLKSKNNFDTNMNERIFLFHENFCIYVNINFAYIILNYYYEWSMYIIFINHIYQPLRPGRIWHKVNF